MDFVIDEEMILNLITETLNEVGKNVSNEKFNEIAETIDKTLPGAIDIIANEAMQYWKSEARGVNTGWGEKYAQSIKIKSGEDEAEVYIDESMKDKTSDKSSFMFVQMVEKGMKSFSIKDALLASDKAKTGPDGIKYITVPFPVSTPRKAGQGHQSGKFGGREMTSEMHKLIKSGGRLKVGVLKTGEDVSGLTRYVTRQRHSQYGIFRRVSAKSTGWIHPGVSPTPVFPSVVDYVNKRFNEIVVAYCKEIIREFA
jgi:hypothetical protein